jgi:hypothetical protein
VGELPASGGLGIADDPEVGEGLELGDELLARQRVERWLGGSTEVPQELLGSHPRLPNDGAKGADRDVLSVRNNHETRLIGSEDERVMAPFSATGGVHETCVPQRSDDLSRRERRKPRRHTATRKEVVQRCSEVSPSRAASSMSSSRAFSR